MVQLQRAVVCVLVGIGIALAASGSAVQVLKTDSDLAERMAAELTRRSLPASVVTPEEAASAAVTSQTELLIAAHVGKVRAPVMEAIARRIDAGGKVVVIGEPPFQSVTYSSERAWVSADELRARTPSQPFLTPQEFEKGYFVSSDLGDDAGRLNRGTALIPGTTAPQSILKATIPNLKSWVTFSSPVRNAPPAKALTLFWARGTTDTRMLSLEYKERDGSRWIATVDLAPEWRFYALAPKDFQFWFDSESIKRGGPGDVLNLANAQEFVFGLAMTHTRLKPGRHTFEVGQFRTAAPDDLTAADARVPQIDGISPKWMLYPIHPKRALVHEAYRAEVTGDLPLPPGAWSSYWRPMGSGFRKDRTQRFIPVVTALNADGTRAGTLAAIYYVLAGNQDEAIYGYVSVDDDELLKSAGWMDVIASMARRIEWRALMREGGATEFTYDLRDITTSGLQLGARTKAVASPEGTSVLTMRLLAGERVLHEATTDAAPRQQGRLKTSYAPAEGETSQPLRVRTELRAGERLLDVIEHEIGFDGPRGKGSFMTARDGLFRLDGKPWRAFGVNYMPSSGLARLVQSEFEFYLQDASYDPEIVEADLRKIASLGMNMISVFIYAESKDSGNLPDLLRRARAHGLLVNLSLRPNEAPFPASDKVLSTLIKAFRTAEKDEIMAYDIAWEPWWGEFRRRSRFGSNWADWAIEKHGSIAAAEKAWGFRFGSREALEMFPSDAQLRKDGPWTAAAADYHRFVDEFLGKAYRHARETIRALDPDHLVSFRQSEGGNPLVEQAIYPIGLQVVADAVDFFSPEGYGLGDDDRKARTMLFTRSYGQALAPGKPMLWAEFGFSVWNGSSFDVQPELLNHQADVYDRIFRYAQQSRSAGAVCWWFPGGFRHGENSDYGIVNPDGTKRPVEEVLRKWADVIKSPPAPVKWEPVITARRSDSAKAYEGVYDRLEERFWRLVNSERIPLVKIEP